MTSADGTLVDVIGSGSAFHMEVSTVGTHLEFCSEHTLATS